MLKNESESPAGQISPVLNKRSSSAILATLCVLTLIGSAFTILRAIVYFTISSFGGAGETWADLMNVRGSLYLLTSIGTIIGAVKMLNKEMLGLHVYTVSQVIYLITVFFALSYYLDKFKSNFGDQSFAIMLVMFFVVPSVVILALYWTQMAKQHLK
jgi:hypothetical protein